MANKIGCFICTGCEIGECLDVEKISKVSSDEFKLPVTKTHPVLCGEEGLNLVKQDIEAEGLEPPQS